MSDDKIRFDDGAAYEEYMGVWSRQVGERFLDWLALPAGLRWLDDGCGSGAFAEILMRRSAPATLHGVDPSAAQLAFARARTTATETAVQFQQADAMSLPFGDDSFDAAVMALVIFFVPDPAKGVAEMARVVHPGGTVSAYAWDILGGGFPYAAMGQEMRELGVPPPLPPSVEAAGIEALHALWTKAGLEAVETTVFTVERTFADFDHFWRLVITGPSILANLGKLDANGLAVLKQRMRARLPPAPDGSIRYSARANAVKGRVASW